LADDTKKRCFVLAPIGEEGSAERRHSDAVLDMLLRPVLLELGYEAFRGDESHGSVIIEAILQDLATVDLAIADLTFANPNVMFELGVRLAWCLPVIVIAHKRTKLPFDARHFRVILYAHPRREEARTKAQSEIRRRVKGIERRYAPPGDFHRYFREVISKRLLYDQIRSALGDLLTGLEDVIWEVEHEISPKRRSTLPAIARLAGAPFATLEDKIHVLRDQARRIGLSAGLRRAFDDVEAILARWKAFNEGLSKRPSGTKAVQWALSQSRDLADLIRPTIDAVRP